MLSSIIPWTWQNSGSPDDNYRRRHLTRMPGTYSVPWPIMVDVLGRALMFADVRSAALIFLLHLPGRPAAFALSGLR